MADELEKSEPADQDQDQDQDHGAEPEVPAEDDGTGDTPYDNLEDEKSENDFSSILAEKESALEVAISDLAEANKQISELKAKLFQGTVDTTVDDTSDSVEMPIESFTYEDLLS